MVSYQSSLNHSAAQNSANPFPLKLFTGFQGIACSWFFSYFPRSSFWSLLMVSPFPSNVLICLSVPEFSSCSSPLYTFTPWRSHQSYALITSKYWKIPNLYLQSDISMLLIQHLQLHLIFPKCYPYPSPIPLNFFTLKSSTLQPLATQTWSRQKR